jgi:hypothetical protein
VSFALLELPDEPVAALAVETIKGKEMEREFKTETQ